MVIHQVHLTKHIHCVALQMSHLKLVQHALQNLRLLTVVSLSLWTVLLNVGEGIHARDPIVIAVDSSALPVILHLTVLPLIVEAIAQAINALPPVYANNFPTLSTATSFANQCHPLMLHTYKPILTTGDGDCIFHALSRVVCGRQVAFKGF